MALIGVDANGPLVFLSGLDNAKTGRTCCLEDDISPAVEHERREFSPFGGV